MENCKLDVFVSLGLILNDYHSALVSFSSWQHEQLYRQYSQSRCNQPIDLRFFLERRDSNSNKFGRSFASFKVTKSEKKGCFRASSGLILAQTSQVSIFQMRSIYLSSGSYRFKILLQSLPLSFGSCQFSLPEPSTAISFGVPKTFMISINCSIELSPGKMGSQVINSTMMQPTDHISISQP